MFSKKKESHIYENESGIWYYNADSGMRYFVENKDLANILQQEIDRKKGEKQVIRGNALAKKIYVSLRYGGLATIAILGIGGLADSKLLVPLSATYFFYKIRQFPSRYEDLNQKKESGLEKKTS